MLRPPANSTAIHRALTPAAAAAAQLWRAFRNHTLPAKAEDGAAQTAADDHAASASAPAVGTAATATIAAAAVTAAAADEAGNSSSIRGGGGRGGGSCTCTCPPGRGFGVCFEMPAGTPPHDASCNVHLPQAAAFCPAVGVPKQCHDPPIPADEDCSKVGVRLPAAPLPRPPTQPSLRPPLSAGAPQRRRRQPEGLGWLAELQCGTPTTWTIVRHDGANHLGFIAVRSPSIKWS